MLSLKACTIIPIWIFLTLLFCSLRNSYSGFDHSEPPLPYLAFILVVVFSFETGKGRMAVVQHVYCLLLSEGNIYLPPPPPHDPAKSTAGHWFCLWTAGPNLQELSICPWLHCIIEGQNSSACVLGKEMRQLFWPSDYPGSPRPFMLLSSITPIVLNVRAP